MGMALSPIRHYSVLVIGLGIHMHTRRFCGDTEVIRMSVNVTSPLQVTAAAESSLLAFLCRCAVLVSL